MRTPSANHILTAVLLLCAVTTTSLVVRRELFLGSSAAAATQSATFVPDWRQALGNGATLGSQNARVQLIEFGDFQCPYCQSFYRALQSVQPKYPGQITLTFIHFPLAFHEFAGAAARAAECADDQGHFQQLYDYFFQHPESLGHSKSGELAQAAKVQDVPRFEACVGNDAQVPRIVEGKQLAQAFNVRGTPTLLINGWKLSASPTSSELSRMIDAVLQGKPPISGSTRVSHNRN